MELQHGKSYRNRVGVVVTVQQFVPNNPYPEFCFRDTNGGTYRKDGSVMHAIRSMNDLVAEAEEEQKTQQLSQQQAEDLLALVRNTAKEIAPDYPNIENCDVWECVWAIRSTHLGTNKANEDWKKFGMAMCQHFGVSHEEAIKIYEKIVMGKEPA